MDVRSIFPIQTLDRMTLETGDLHHRNYFLSLASNLSNYESRLPDRLNRFPFQPSWPEALASMYFDAKIIKAFKGSEFFLSRSDRDELGYIRMMRQRSLAKDLAYRRLSLEFSVEQNRGDFLRTYYASSDIKTDFRFALMTAKAMESRSGFFDLLAHSYQKSLGFRQLIIDTRDECTAEKRRVFWEMVYKNLEKEPRPLSLAGTNLQTVLSALGYATSLGSVNRALYQVALNCKNLGLALQRNSLTQLTNHSDELQASYEVHHLALKKAAEFKSSSQLDDGPRQEHESFREFLATSSQTAKWREFNDFQAKIRGLVHRSLSIFERGNVERVALAKLSMSLKMSLKQFEQVEPKFDSSDFFADLRNQEATERLIDRRVIRKKNSFNHFVVESLRENGLWELGLVNSLDRGIQRSSDQRAIEVRSSSPKETNPIWWHETNPLIENQNFYFQTSEVGEQQKSRSLGLSLERKGDGSIGDQHVNSPSLGKIETELHERHWDSLRSFKRGFEDEHESSPHDVSLKKQLAGFEAQDHFRHVSSLALLETIRSYKKPRSS